MKFLYTNNKQNVFSTMKLKDGRRDLLNNIDRITPNAVSGKAVDRQHITGGTDIGLFILMSILWLSIPVFAQSTIKVGILHSESGTMAISEAPLIDVVEMAVGEINKAGGLLGRQLETVKVDPASNWDTYAKEAENLLTEHGVSVVFGCWTSLSRQRVLPVFEKHNGLLFYPVQYEGEEKSNNIFYTGAAPNQQAIPAVDFLWDRHNGKTAHWMLIGTDYVYPRTTNKILGNYLASKGIDKNQLYEAYTPFGHEDWKQIVSEINASWQQGPTIVISTINGSANVPFYQELTNQGIAADQVPVMAFSIGEEELRAMDTTLLKGHLAAWNYFMSINNPENLAFIDKFRKHLDAFSLFGAGSFVTNDPMEATYIGVHLWAQAVAKAGSTEADAVREAIGGLSFQAPSGFEVQMDETNHHLHKPVFIGQIQDDGQFDILWRTDNLIRAEVRSPYLSNNNLEKPAHTNSTSLKY